MAESNISGVEKHTLPTRVHCKVTQQREGFRIWWLNEITYIKCLNHSEWWVGFPIPIVIFIINKIAFETD